MAKLRLVQYLFVHEEATGAFPVRLLIQRDGEMVSFEAELSGVVAREEVESTEAELRRSYPSPRYTVAKSWASDWGAVERSYRGLRDHEAP